MSNLGGRLHERSRREQTASGNIDATRADRVSKSDKKLSDTVRRAWYIYRDSMGINRSLSRRG